MVEGAYSVFPGQQRPKCISFTLDSPIQNRGLRVLHGWGKMGYVLNGVITQVLGVQIHSDQQLIAQLLIAQTTCVITYIYISSRGYML